MIYDVDLHMHTAYSDGSSSIEEILRLVKERGIGTFSVTDHDTLESCKAIAKTERRSGALKGLTYFCGIELSCRYKNIDFHLLGYGFDIENKRLSELVGLAKRNRREKTARLTEYLKSAHGIIIPEEDTRRLAFSDNNIGKPDFANILIRMGYGTGVKEVIDKYLDDFKASDLKTNAADAINAIKGAYGFTSLAHPMVISKDYGYTYKDIDSLAAEFKAMGLDALEVYYGKHSAKDKSEYRKIAIKHGLMMSGGSDFHGKNKPGIELGDLGEGMDAGSLGDIYEFVTEMMQ